MKTKKKHNADTMFNVGTMKIKTDFFKSYNVRK